MGCRLARSSAPRAHARTQNPSSESYYSRAYQYVFTFGMRAVNPTVIPPPATPPSSQRRPAMEQRTDGYMSQIGEAFERVKDRLIEMG